MKGLEKFEPDTCYHIINHAIGSENLFRNEENYRYFLSKYAHYMPAVCSTLAYCLMPNHIHFLIQTHSAPKLEEHTKYKNDFHKLIMQEWSNLLNGYTKAYNRLFGRRGALWIDYTRRFSIGHEVHLSNVINYIHQNPVKHGFTQNMIDWPHSSYNSLLSGRPTKLERAAVIYHFGGAEQFVVFHKNQRPPNIEDWEY